jgi:hypothetical protein
MCWKWSDATPRTLAGITICQHGHLFAGNAAPEIDVIVKKIARNIHEAVVAAVRLLDNEARRLIVEEQLALARQAGS